MSDLYIKSGTGNYTVATIQVLRKHSTESMSELKNRLTNNLPLLYFDTLEDELEDVLGILAELEATGIQLEYYTGDRVIDKQILVNFFGSAAEIKDDVEREMEMETTDIVAVIDVALHTALPGILIKEDDHKAYYAFDYSADLIAVLDNPAITFYQRTRGYANSDAWDLISTDAIRKLMGMD